jgi:hypothetical protein
MAQMSKSLETRGTGYYFLKITCSFLDSEAVKFKYFTYAVTYSSYRMIEF